MQRLAHKTSHNLKEIFEYLEAIADSTNDFEFQNILTQLDVYNLEFKQFDQICFFLLKHSKPVDVKNVQWPVIDKKQHTIFIKKVFDAVNELRLNYSWAKFPNFQKSHFHDPRPETDKVLEFLLKLCSLTVKLLTNYQPSAVAADELKEEINALTKTTEENELLIGSLQTQLQEIKLKSASLAPALECQRERLFSEGLLTPLEQFIQATIEKKQDDLELQLSHQISALSKLNGQYFA